MDSMITAKGNIRHGCAKLTAFGNDPGTMLTMRDKLTEAGGFQQRVANVGMHGPPRGSSRSLRPAMVSPPVSARAHLTSTMPSLVFLPSITTCGGRSDRAMARRPTSISTGSSPATSGRPSGRSTATSAGIVGDGSLMRSAVGRWVKPIIHRPRGSTVFCNAGYDLGWFNCDWDASRPDHRQSTRHIHLAEWANYPPGFI
ncbi:hypothetical protein [Bradyrhizobium sp. i1.15.2]|uniref:hypothetical protein n=1 Tax=Bradyrhizobium sp. i1.15.2 TaxID=3156362 RepID=UPI00339AF600